MKSSIAVALVVLSLAACTSSGDRAARTQGAAPVGSTSTEPNRNALVDLHNVDWGNIDVPGRSCLRNQPIRLHNGQALLPDNTNGSPVQPGANAARYDLLDDRNKPVVYGNFEGGAYDDVAVPLDCNNNGGTADGAILYSLAVYSGRAGKPTSLGLITPQHQAKNELPTLIAVTAIAPGRITVSEYWYGPHDGTCCPAGRAATTWTLSAGKVIPVATRVTALPT